MKIFVAGGNGLIGGKLVEKLRALNHDVLAGSTRSGVNAVTGEGLEKAIAGASVVVDVMNAPSWEDDAVLKFFETTSRNLLATGAKAGVKHHVALSVVGTERLLGSGYFRAKLAQEKIIEASPVPYTIVRATQFYEFLAAIGDFGNEGGVIRLPSALMQPMLAEDVSTLMVDYTLGKPANGMVEIGGPEVMGIDAAVRRVLAAKGDPRKVVADSNAKYYGMPVSERALVPEADARRSATWLEDWLAKSK